MQKVALIGGGVMGEAVLVGLLRAGADPADVSVVESRPERAAELAQTYGIATPPLAAAIADAGTVVLVVKPQQVRALTVEVGALLRSGALVVSLAAGVRTATLEALLPENTPVLRVMPNTPARIGLGMAALSPGRHCSPAHVEQVTSMLSATGSVLTVPEDQQDAVTAVSGSGPAYLFYVAEAMVEAGVELGLERATSTELVVQTLVGAAGMLRTTGQDPAELRRQVSSPNGTTVAAIARLADAQVTSAFAAAMRAARDRSRELSGD